MHANRTRRGIPCGCPKQTQERKWAGTRPAPTAHKQSRSCHSIFALSLTRFAFRNPNGITYGYATFDLLLQNLSITKRCFVILSKANQRSTPEGAKVKNLKLCTLFFDDIV